MPFIYDIIYLYMSNSRVMKVVYDGEVLGKHY